MPPKWKIEQWNKDANAGTCMDNPKYDPCEDDYSTGVIYGGEPPNLTDDWRWDGHEWKQVPPPNQPLTQSDIQSMTMEQYAKVREQLIGELKASRIS